MVRAGVQPPGPVEVFDVSIGCSSHRSGAAARVFTRGGGSATPVYRDVHLVGCEDDPGTADAATLGFGPARRAPPAGGRPVAVSW